MLTLQDRQLDTVHSGDQALVLHSRRTTTNRQSEESVYRQCILEDKCLTLQDRHLATVHSWEEVLLLQSRRSTTTRQRILKDKCLTLQDLGLQVEYE